jgi:hypothetical protein
MIQNFPQQYRYRMNYLGVFIFDIDTNFFYRFLVKISKFLVNSEWLIEQLDEFQNWNLQCFSSIKGQDQCILMHCGDIRFIIGSNLA